MKRIKSIGLAALLGHCVVTTGGITASGRQLPQRTPGAETPAARQPKARRWRPATYRGLTMGQSTYADMVYVLGEPLKVSRGEKVKSHLLKSYFYKAYGEVFGDLVVTVKQEPGREASGTIYGIELRPENLSKEEMFKHFGGDYTLGKYDSDECLGNGESAPLYESVKGSTVLLEYRSRGLAVSVDYRDAVYAIWYVSEPIGPEASKCKR